ncbi:TRAP transporter substrate-binding protein [Oceanobacter sp. 5_MG-2023]|uniref:TRAP transporter substrate-binding protein n=1 Tax=Oceanobacter sp. 5_MG-2023 TaxID=3062645 RepID=UPI0026E35B90|nr:TRAP transporter substrate-binding protein [Oceanobacter sp. 5_MG-2023]MDO6681236.1 TRAP transporter substrate-binding protein [Oceanobacter sp. 5_MG-2023]
MVTATSAAAETIRFGMITTPDHAWSRLMQQFKNTVEGSSGNTIRVRESRFAKVRGESSIIELLGRGQLQAAIVAVGSLTTLDPALNGWLMPYQFADTGQLRRAAQRDDAKTMLVGLERHNLVALGYAFSGMRVIMSPAAMASVQDLKGKKVGTFPNDVFYNWYRQLGADPQPIQIQDIRLWFEQEKIDAIDIDLATAVDLQLSTQAPNLMYTRHMAFPGVFVVSRSWWDALTPEQQQAISAAFTQAEQATFAGLEKAEQADLKQLRGEGVSVKTYTEADFNSVPQKLRDFYYGTNERLKRFGMDQP